MGSFSGALAELVDVLGRTMGAESSQALVRTLCVLHDEVRDQVTKAEFRDLQAVVQELAEAQKRTEERVNELAEAQKRTEERVNELAEAQKRTEERLNELAEAQKRTEERLNQLAEAQKRTEERVNQLAEAQRKTEEKLAQLANDLATLTREHAKTREMLGNLTDTVGFFLEDRAIVGLPEVLKERFGIEVVGELERRWVDYPDGRHDEINVYGTARRDGRTITIIGECKTRASTRDIRDLLKKVERLKRHKYLGDELFVCMVSYQLVPQVVSEAKAKNVAVIPSFWLRKL